MRVRAEFPLQRSLERCRHRTGLALNTIAV